MRSPFPGMDPYIEARGLWRDFHRHIIEKIFDVVSEALPEGYVARVDERSYIALAESDERTERHFEPDVKVTGPRARSKAGVGPAVAAAPEAEAVTLRAFIEEDFDESFIDIFETEPERRLVTSVEVLSPSNKTRGSEGWRRYLRKRQALLRGKANLVEIDLLRGGDRMPMLDPLPDSPYYVLVSRAEKAPLCRVWRAFFDRPLPTVPVPLSRPAPDIPLSLQPLVEAVARRSRYHVDIDYSRPLTPPLTAEQSAWLAGRPRPEAPAPPKRRARRRP